MKKLMILEDNKNTLEYLKHILQEICKTERIYAFNYVKDAYECVIENSIDLFLIDIILDTKRPGDSSGLKFVERIRQIEKYEFTPVIFVTALEDPKLYTYEKLHCYGFIEKPFCKEQIRELVVSSLRFPNKHTEKKTLYFRKDGIILAVDTAEIVYAESINHMIYIHTNRSDTLKIPYITLKQLKEEIGCSDIIQCGRNTIVNKNYIVNIDITNRYIYLKNGYGKLEIGITYKKNMKEIFAQVC